MLCRRADVIRAALGLAGFVGGINAEMDFAVADLFQRFERSLIRGFQRFGKIGAVNPPRMQKSGARC